MRHATHFSLSLSLIYIASDLAFDRQNESEIITSASRRHVGCAHSREFFLSEFSIKINSLERPQPNSSRIWIVFGHAQAHVSIYSQAIIFCMFLFSLAIFYRCGLLCSDWVRTYTAKKRTSFVTFIYLFFIITFVCMFTVSIRFRNVLLGADILANGLIKRKYYPKLVLCAYVTLFLHVILRRFFFYLFWACKIYVSVFFFCATTLFTSSWI